MTTFANINDYMTDPELESEGVTLGFGKGRFIDIKRAGGSNVAYTTYVAEQWEKYDKDIKNGTMEEGIARKEMIKAYSLHVVQGWKGFLDSKGNEIPFTPQTCIELFTASPEIFNKVRDNADDLDNFRIQEVNETGKE